MFCPAFSEDILLNSRFFFLRNCDYLWYGDGGRWSRGMKLNMRTWRSLNQIEHFSRSIMPNTMQDTLIYSLKLPLASKTAPLSLCSASFTSSSPIKLNAARTYADFLRSPLSSRALARNIVPGRTRTPCWNAVVRITYSESPSCWYVSSTASGWSRSLNLESDTVQARINRESMKSHQKNIPASGRTHTANPLKCLLSALSNESRFFLYSCATPSQCLWNPSYPHSFRIL